MRELRRHGGFRAAAIAAAAIASVAMPGFARAGDIRILEAVTLDAPTVRLGDIAEIRDFEDDLDQRIRGVVLADAPMPGASRDVHVRDVFGVLQACGANLAHVHLFGSTVCVVSRPSMVRPSPKREREPIEHKPAKQLRRHADTVEAPAVGTIEAAVRDYITARLQRDGGRLEIAFNRTSRLVRETLDAAATAGAYRIRERDPLGLGLCALEIDLLRGADVSETVAIVGNVELLKPVLVARKPINRGSVIDKRDLAIEERRFARFEDVGLTDIELAAGYEATRLIRPGEMLGTDVLRERPLVERGDIVRILVRGDGVQITTTGKAQASGALGDVIPVARNGSRRKRDVIDAMVSGPGVVTYEGVRQVARR